MASQNSNTTCLMCFESRPLKIVGNCNHSFCSECLSTVLDSLDDGSTVFPCPSCKADCPRPWDGVKGMLDITEIKKEPGEPNDRDTTSGESTCGICTYKSLEVQAINLCSECGYLPICKDCSIKHKGGKATSAHSLTPISRKVTVEAVCGDHNKPLDRYCKECAKPVCVICVAVDHSEHDVEKLAFMIRSIGQDVEVKSELKRGKLQEERRVHTALLQMKDAAPTVDEQDNVIKVIEDHAQKCIEKILKWKEALKKEVKGNYKIVRDIPELLEKFADDIQTLDKLVNRASKLLFQTEYHPGHLDELLILQKDLEAHQEIHDDIIKRDYSTELFKLKEESYRFVPEDVQDCFGKLEIFQRANWLNLESLFSHTMPVDSEDMYIPSVAMLGSHFAVAHPVKPEQPSDAIDIYEFPKTLKCTLREKVIPLYDMCRTPDGQLAVLSDGTQENSCCVKLFDIEAGYKSSTRDIDVAKPLSLGVTPLQEYVILGHNPEGLKLIVVIDKNGRQTVSKTIDEVLGQGIKKSPRISCGGRIIFLKGDENIHIYEIKKAELHTVQKVETYCNYQSDYLTDISATVWEDFFVLHVHNSKICLVKGTEQNNSLEWENQRHKDTQTYMFGEQNELRVSTKDGKSAVLTSVNKIQVYSLDHF